MNGQRVTNAVSAIHRSIGLSYSDSHISDSCDFSFENVSNSDSNSTAFNTLNYSDDFSGIEESKERATLSFNIMGSLLQELGLSESIDKAVSPCQIITYLGIQFNSVKLEMSINDAKCKELKLNFSQLLANYCGSQGL